MCRITYSNYDSESKKFNFSIEGLDKRTLENKVDDPMSKYRKMLDENVSVTLTKIALHTLKHSVDLYEETKDGLSHFLSERNVQDGGLHACRFNIKEHRFNILASIGVRKNIKLLLCSFLYVLINF